MFLGHTTRERLNTFVHDVISTAWTSLPFRCLLLFMRHAWIFGSDVSECISESRCKEGRIQSNQNADRSIRILYRDHPEAMSREYVALIEKKGVPKDQAVCDWLSGMTDQYSMKKFKEIFIPRAWEVY